VLLKKVTASSLVASKTVKQSNQHHQPSPQLTSGSKVAPKAIISDDGDIEIQTPSIPFNQLRHQQYQQQQQHQQHHAARVLQRNNINRMSMIKIMEDNSNSAKQDALRVNSERIGNSGNGNSNNYGFYAAVNKPNYSQYQSHQQQPYQKGGPSAPSTNYPQPGGQFSYTSGNPMQQQQSLYQSQLAAAAAAAAAVCELYFYLTFLISKTIADAHFVFLFGHCLFLPDIFFLGKKKFGNI
jgi:hypothetical protein